jgi:hypothetical protein
MKTINKLKQSPEFWVTLLFLAMGAAAVAAAN